MISAYLRLSLRAQLLLLALFAIVFTTAASLIVERSTIRRQGTEMTRMQMRGLALAAETAHTALAVSWPAVSASPPGTAEQASAAGMAISTKAIEPAAKSEGFAYHIAASQPLNPTHAAVGSESAILASLERRGQEYFESNGMEIVYARPIQFDSGCSSCHLNPGTAAVVLRAKTSRVDAVVRASFGRAIGWILPIVLLLTGLLYAGVRSMGRRVLAVSQEVERQAGALSAAADQLSGASHRLAEGAAGQQAAVAVGAAGLDEVESLASRNLERITEAGGMVSETSAEVGRADGQIQQVVAVMHEAAASSSQISSIVKVIDEIAFQTNILALNAAIEAARAGVAGTGFAVVAGEVRLLAERCSAASSETAELIEKSIDRTKSGAKLLDAMAGTFRRINELSGRLDGLVGAMGANSQEQSSSVGRLASEMKRVEGATQATAATALTTTSKSSEIRKAAHDLRSLVDSLRTLVIGAQRGEKSDAELPHLP